MTSEGENNVSAFLARFEYLLKQERREDVSRSFLLLSKCGPKLLEKKGLAIGGLYVVNISVGLGGKSLVELAKSLAYSNSQLFDAHSLRVGDLARIEDYNSGSTTKIPKTDQTEKSQRDGVEGVVYRISDSRIVLFLDSDASSMPEIPERCRLIKMVNTVTYDRMESTIDTLQSLFTKVEGGAAKKKFLPEINAMHRTLLGLQPLGQPANSSEEGLSWFDSSLNDSQKAAVRYALGSPEVACIWGPPGTGKTHTLVEIILQLLSNDLRVLVCGASNLSVDNILERLLRLKGRHLPPTMQGDIPELRLLRLSHPARTLPSLVESTLEYQARHSDGAQLARDCKRELEKKMATMSRKGGGKSKGPRISKEERRKAWEEIRELRKEYRKREFAVTKDIVKNANVVVATCHSAGSSHLRDQLYDVLIIDEATQAMEPVCWVPILKSRKLIMAGDPMQLPPTVLSVEGRESTNRKNLPAGKTKGKATKESGRAESPSDSAKPEILESRNGTSRQAVLRPSSSLSETLFSRLEDMYGPAIKRMLQIQYRMNSQISAFPSKTLYDSKLQDHPSVDSRLLQDIVAESTDDILSQPVIFYDTSGLDYFERTDVEDPDDEGSKCNENEASIVVHQVGKLVSLGITANQITILTPYQAQVQLLTSLLRPQYPEIEIGTVDGMQGREQEVVILSLVRSNNQREVGFLKDKRRLNVAMTRAKRQLIVIGDSQTIKQGGSFLRDWMGWLESEADLQYPGDLT